MRLVDFARNLEAAQRSRRAAAHRDPWVPTATPASSIGYQCERRIAYQRLEPMAAAAPGEELSSLFEEGDLHEKDVKAELSALGLDVVDGQTQFYDERLDLRGHIDGRLMIGSGKDAARVPVEIKSTTGRGPSTQAEWARETGLFGRYYAQLQIYMFLTSSPEALGLFKDKITGLWTVCAIELDFAYAEGLLKKAERVRDAVRLKVLPDRIPDRSECRGCPFYLACLPGDAPVDPLLLAEDDQLLSDLEAREKLSDSAQAHGLLDKRIKERFKLTQGHRFIVGSWLITKTVASNGAVTVKTSRLTKAALAAKEPK